MEEVKIKTDIRKIKDYDYCRVDTSINFQGDIRNLKNFLLSKKNLLPEGRPIPETNREIPRELFAEIYSKYNGKCAKCNNKGKQVHHKIPFSIEPIHEVNNLVLLCKKCHRDIHKNYPIINVKINKKE